MKTHIVLPWLLVLGLSLEYGKSKYQPSLLLEVENVKKSYQVWMAKGVHFTKPPYKIATGWAAELQDPSGNTIRITDYIKD